MGIFIDKGTSRDVDAVERLYNDLNDYLDSHINYPGWAKGTYPVRQQAEDGVAGQSLFITRIGEKVAGSVILNHMQDYKGDVRWGVAADNSEILNIHTLAVHPDCFRSGVGRQLLDFAFCTAKGLQLKAVRLDVYENNIPAIKLYEKLGYNYIERVDLGLGSYGLDWFRLYEKLI